MGMSLSLLSPTDSSEPAHGYFSAGAYGIRQAITQSADVNDTAEFNTKRPQEFEATGPCRGVRECMSSVVRP
jgi:hypothetical protein